LTKIRLCFSKSGQLRFVGHLDFLKVFQKTIRRAKLPMAYSQGFNPHMQLSFALPLPLGMISFHDYADIALESEMPCDEIIARINSHAPQGLVIKKACEFTGSGAAALVTVADYYFVEAKPKQTETIKSLLSQEKIIVPKKIKSGIKDTDIRPDIIDLTDTMLRLSAGSGRFLNPLIVAKLLIEQDVDASALVRHELYWSDIEKGLVPLYETPIH